MRKNKGFKKITSRWVGRAPSLKLNTDVSKSWLAEEMLNRNALSENVFVVFSEGECRRKHWGNHLPRRSYFAKCGRMHTYIESKTFALIAKRFGLRCVINPSERFHPV